MRKTLREIFEEHTGKVSDKWTLYLEEWDQLFCPYRDQQIHLLEIGIQITIFYSNKRTHFMFNAKLMLHQYLFSIFAAAYRICNADKK